MSGSHLASLSGRVCLAGLLVPGAHSGGVPEWTIGHAWRACVPFGYRGFESHPLSHDSRAIPDTNAEGCGVNGAWRQRGSSSSLLALLLFDLFGLARLVHFALVTGAKLLFRLGLRLLRLVERFVELLLGRAECASDRGHDVVVGLDRRRAGIYASRRPVNLSPPRALGR